VSKPVNSARTLRDQRTRWCKARGPVAQAGNELFRANDYGGAAGKYGECLAANPGDAAALANRSEVGRCRLTPGFCS